MMCWRSQRSAFWGKCVCGRKVAKLEHFPFASTSPFVIAGLDPAIHLLRKGSSLEEDGPAGQVRG
jgi:hypothetical protein